MKPALRRISPFLILLSATAWLSGCAQSPNGPIALSELEHRFDLNRAKAVADFGGRPIIVEAKVASVHDDRLTLQSIYLLDVQAYFSFSTAGIPVGSAVRLLCQNVEADDYPTGAKPRLSDCRLVSN